MSDHVVIRHPCTTLCLMCGRSYVWNTPVPVALFCGGNEAWAKDHAFCREWRQEWRARLLATLMDRYIAVRGERGSEQKFREVLAKVKDRDADAGDAP